MGRTATTGVDRRERTAFVVVAALSALAVALRLLDASPVAVFGSAAVAVAGLAWLLGIATEEAGEAVGPRLFARRSFIELPDWRARPI